MSNLKQLYEPPAYRAEAIVDGYGDHEDDPHNHVLPEAVHAKDVETAADNAHNRGTDEGSYDRTLATSKAGATENRGDDDRELPTFLDDLWIAIELAPENNPRDPGCKTSRDKKYDARLVDSDAREPSSALI